MWRGSRGPSAMVNKGLATWDALRTFYGGELPSDIDPVRYVHRQWEPFYEALAIGSWYATGAPAAKSRQIPVYLWAHGLYIDPNTDIASGCGYEFTDVRFFLTKPAARRRSPLRKDNKAADEAEWEALYRKHEAKCLEAHGRTPTIDEDNLFYKAIGISRAKGRKIRGEFREKHSEK